MGDAVRITDGFQSSKARGKAKDDGTGSAVPLVGRRFVVFVLGGITYAELRSMHEVGRTLGREIILGATAMITPRAYLLALKHMKKLHSVVV